MAESKDLQAKEDVCFIRWWIEPADVPIRSGLDARYRAVLMLELLICGFHRWKFCISSPRRRRTSPTAKDDFYRREFAGKSAPPVHNLHPRPEEPQKIARRNWLGERPEKYQRKPATKSRATGRQTHARRRGRGESAYQDDLPAIVAEFDFCLHRRRIRRSGRDRRPGLRIAP